MTYPTKLNKVYQFVYTGGSHPGEVRTVLLTDVTSSKVSGYCFERSGYRHYFISDIEQCRELKTGIVSTDVLPVDKNAVMALYSAEGWEVYDDNENARLVLYKAPSHPSYKVAGRGMLCITTDTGSVNLKLQNKTVIVETVDMSSGDKDYTVLTATQLIDAIAGLK